MKEKKVYYKSNALTVSFSPELCIHAAECVKGLPNVFSPKKKPWVDVNAEDPDKIIEVIDRCPSGALKYKNNSNNDNRENIKMEKTKITVMPNGPLMVEGDLTVNKMSGDNIKDGEKLFLCRCGESNNKPFCDGAHKKAEFKAE